MPAILDKILRIGEGKILRQLEAVAQAVNAIEDDFVAMSDDELRGMTAEFKERLANGESLDDLMPERSPPCARRPSGSPACAPSTSR